MMSQAYARIILRYGAGALASYGLMGTDTFADLLTDPDVELVLGGTLVFITEMWYRRAKQTGGET